MEKIIKIGNKDYKMKASAFTQFAYKNSTGRSFLSDIQKLVELKKGKVEEDLSKIDGVTELVLRIAYTMVTEADKNQVINYEEFLRGIDSLYDDTSWLEDVILLACSPLSGQLQK